MVGTSPLYIQSLRHGHTLSYTEQLMGANLSETKHQRSFVHFPLSLWCVCVCVCVVCVCRTCIGSFGTLLIGRLAVAGWLAGYL